MVRGRLDSISDLSVAAKVAEMKAETKYNVVFEWLKNMKDSQPFLHSKLLPLVETIVSLGCLSPDDLYLVLTNRSAAAAIVELQKKVDFFREKSHEVDLTSLGPEFGVEAPSSVQAKPPAADAFPLAGFSSKISQMLRAASTPVTESEVPPSNTTDKRK